MMRKSSFRFLIPVIAICLWGCGGGGDDGDSGEARHCPPSVVAGADKTAEERQVVTLSPGNVSWCGSANFLWTQTGGTQVILNNATGMNSANFAAPMVMAGKDSETLTFRFSMTDSDGQSASAVTKVNVYRSGGTSGTADLSRFYDKVPNIADCYEGVLKASEKQKVLDKINGIRSLHKLLPLTYAYSDDRITAKAALMIVANNRTGHQPSTSDYCYSAEGLDGSLKSNLYIRSYQSASESDESAPIIVVFLKDIGTESLGYRRWILDPFLKSVSFGRADGKPRVENTWNTTGVALKVINTEDADISGSKIAFVAYPFEDYPKDFVDKDGYFSFSVLADNTARSKNQSVDFSKASVLISDESGKSVNVHSQSTDNSLYGLPNLLKWKAENIVENVNYKVRIGNVIVNNETRNFEYEFRLKP